MKDIKQKLKPLVWLNIKSNHNITPHPVPATATATAPAPSIPTASSSTAQPTTSTSQPTRRPRKRALLIGIAADPPPEPVDGFSRRQEAAVDSPLPVSPGRDSSSINRAGTGAKKRSNTGAKPVTKSGSIALITKKLPIAHNDVGLMRKALMTWYGYKSRDIVILIDDNKASRKQPTRANILAAIDNLVSGIEAGDTVFFHFAGHGTQEDTDDVEEEDKKNEVMLTSDGLRIIDNELHAYLVKPLPPGSTLIAVCDACHSGSLLDLPHSKCNAVYVPWVNKGQRRSRVEQNNTTRRQARMSTNHALHNRLRDHSHWSSTSIDGIMKAPSGLSIDGIMKSNHNGSNTTLEMISEDRVLSESPKMLHARPGMAIPKDPQSHSPTQVHAQIPPHGEDLLPHGRSSLSNAYDALSTTRVAHLASTLTSIPISHPHGAHSSSNESLPHGRSSLSKEYEGHSRVLPSQATSTSASQSQSQSHSQPQSHAHFAPIPHASHQNHASGSGSGSSHHAPVPHPPHPQRTPPTRHKHIALKGLSVTTNTSILSRALHTDMSRLGLGDGDGDMVETPCTLYCTGQCASTLDSGGQRMIVLGEKDGVDVICLSSSTDSQKTWIDAKGRSMSYQLYKILEKNHHPTLPSLLTLLSHSLHKSYMKLHIDSRAFHEKCRQKRLKQRAGVSQSKRWSIGSNVNGGNGGPGRRRQSEQEETVVVVEMDNFQEPVLSSFVPLPKGKVWSP